MDFIQLVTQNLLWFLIALAVLLAFNCNVLLAVWRYLFCPATLVTKAFVRNASRSDDSALPWFMLLGVRIWGWPYRWLGSKRRPRNQWIESKLASANNVFRKGGLYQGEVYVPVPIDLGALSGQGANPDMSDRQQVSKLFTGEGKTRLVIWTEGGLGKSSLAAQIALWAMSPDPEERLVPDRPILPVVLDKTVGDQLLEEIVGKLEGLVGVDELADDFVKILLRTKSIMLIIEDFSEWPAERRELIRPDATAFAANLLVVTSRSDEDLASAQNRTTIRPLPIDAGSLKGFLAHCLEATGQGGLLQGTKVRKAVDKFIEVLRDRNVPPQIVRVFAKQLAANRIGDDGELLISFTGLTEQYLKHVNEKCREDEEPDDSLVYQDCKSIAWRCLRDSLELSKVPLTDVLAEMSSVESPFSAEDRFRYLERELKLVERCDLDNNVMLRNAVVAEFLAALFLIKSREQSDEAWSVFQKQARDDRPEAAPFIRAVVRCCREAGEPDRKMLADLEGLGATAIRELPRYAGNYRVISGWQEPLTELPNRLKYRVCELRHRSISAKRARGKFYDLAGMPERTREQIVHRVRRHCSVLSQLENAPNVHHFVDYVEEPDGALWVIEEWIDGQPLSELVEGEPGLDLSEGVRIMREVSLGLQALHEQDFYMRSLDPESVFVESDGTVLLTNFELTKAVGSSISVSTDVSFDGLPYTAPQLRGGERDGHVTGDVYSWGAVFTFVVTRKHWDDTRAHFILAAVTKSELPPKLIECIKACVSPSEKDRPRSMEQVLECF